MQNVLEVKNLGKSFGGIQAISGVDLHIKEGEIVSLIGPNGAGKTTFFNLITGIYDPSEGEIKFGNQFIKKRKIHEMTKMGIARTFQNIRLFPSMTVEENIMVGQFCRTKSHLVSAFFKTKLMRNEEKKVREKALELMELLELTDKKDYLAVDLSYGEQRRVEIARALATEPTLLLLDEPAAGMNSKEKIEMMEMIRKINSIGHTILLIEHNMKLVMDLSDRIIVLDYGQKIAEGTPTEIQNNERVISAYLGKGGEDCA